MAKPSHMSGAGKTRPSMRDVAKAAGVSTACVSNVLNRRRSQEDEIGLKVMNAVAALGYRVNPIASNLRRANSRFIGVVIPDFRNPFFGELLDELEHCADPTDYRIVATSSRENKEIEAREVNELLGWRVAGVLLAPTLGSDGMAPVTAADVPGVIIDRLTGRMDADEVGVANAEAAGDVVARLASIGHRDILVAYSDAGFHNMGERLAGVKAAAAAGDVNIETLVCGFSVESSAAAFAAYFDAHPVPKAIFCLHNIAALAALGAVQERGKRPGEDLALVSFDDSAWMAHVHPGIAAVVQPVAEIARTAWSLLLGRIGTANEAADSGSGNAMPSPAPVQLACRFEPRGTFVAPPSD